MDNRCANCEIKTKCLIDQRIIDVVGYEDMSMEDCFILYHKNGIASDFNADKKEIILRCE